MRARWLISLLMFALAFPALAQDRRGGSLDRVLPHVRQTVPGTFYDAEGPFFGADGQASYRLKWMTPDGRIIWFSVDAQSGRVLGGVPSESSRGRYRDDGDREAGPRPRNNWQDNGGGWGDRSGQGDWGDRGNQHGGWGSQGGGGWGDRGWGDRGNRRGNQGGDWGDRGNRGGNQGGGGWGDRGGGGWGDRGGDRGSRSGQDGWGDRGNRDGNQGGWGNRGGKSDGQGDRGGQGGRGNWDGRDGRGNDDRGGGRHRPGG